MESWRAVTTPRRSPRIRVTSDASIATSVPVPIAIPTSAWASAGASLRPSPTIATRRPCFCSFLTKSAFCDGNTSATTSSMPTSLATAAAAFFESPETIITLRPIFRR